MRDRMVKFAGFFVERVPVDSEGNPVAPLDEAESSAVDESMDSGDLPVAVRAWVPEEHAQWLAQHGLRVLQSNGALTPHHARAHGAAALIVSEECLDPSLDLLGSPVLPTILVTTTPIPARAIPGVLQVREPLAVSELAAAVRHAVGAWHRRTPPH